MNIAARAIVRFITLLLILTYSLNAVQLLSPNGNVSIQFELRDGIPEYQVDFFGSAVVAPSKLGLELQSGSHLAGPFSLKSVRYDTHDEYWEPVWGTTDVTRNHYNELTVELAEIRLPTREMHLTFRAYDDGAAFRYLLPYQDQLQEINITDELTEFNLSEDGTAWWIPNDYDSYEHLYAATPVSEVTGANTPLTIKSAGGYHISIHEADLTDYAGMTLVPAFPGGTAFDCELVPWPDGVKVKTAAPCRSPWRTIQVSRGAAGLAESSLILNLNEPSRIADTSWIKPMKYIGIWWGMHIGKYSWGLDSKHGATTANAIRHIDFAAEYDIPGLLIEGWNEGWENWGQDGAFSFTRPYSDFDIDHITEYARQKGVQLIGHHETGGDVPTYEKQLDDAFAFYRDLGINAVKTGYAGQIRPVGQHHHGQWMVNHYRSVVEKAAEYGIMIDAHEPIKPTGIERTWPNMMTREGVRGMEWNAWSEGNPPEHTTILPFTRGLAGPIDYTPGIFDLHFDMFKKDNRVHTTLAKQLALYVVLYSPVQMAADLPENYRDNDAFEFIRRVPCDWDETRILSAEIGDYVVTARRNDSTWYIGGITDESARQLDVSFDFLDPDRAYLITVFEDGHSADWESNPYPVNIREFFCNEFTVMKIRMAPGGGMAAEIKPRDELTPREPEKSHPWVK